VRLRRVYVEAPLETGTRLRLEGSAASHVTRVLRLRVGAALTLFNGAGGEYEASIDKAHGGEVTVAVGAHHPIERESPLALTLVPGVSRGERMDLVVQKATELGVARLVPVITERSVVQLDAHQADRKLLHWRAIVVAACEQCGRNRLPELLGPLGLREFLRGEPARGTRVMLSPHAARGLDELPRDAAVTVLIGPEGGLSEAEQEAAVQAGFAALRLGPRVLRTETAALTALALLQRQWGDL